MTINRETLGFAAAYEIEVDPEFPADGAWRIPFFAVGRGGALVLRISPDVGEPWAASFALESRGWLNGVYATPAAARFLVLTGIAAFLVDSREPGAVEKLPIAPTVAITRATGTDLVLVGSFTDVAAVDAEGVRWVTRQLFMDGLEFLNGSPGRIVVRGTLRSRPSHPQELELDPRSGRILTGQGRC